MAENNEPNSHLIDDGGVYTNVKIRQTFVFVTFCRILTAVLIILGLVALVVGNM